MIIGIKDLLKLFAISVVSGCAVFVSFLFLNYNIDLKGIKDEILTYQGKVLYDAQVATGKVTILVTAGCLVITTLILLIFYIKNYIDAHSKELGILKALGYSKFNIAKHFWVFGISVFVGSLIGYIAAYIYMPTFYKVQNDEGYFPEIIPDFHIILLISLIVIPTIIFCAMAVLYAFLKMKNPAINLLKEIKKERIKHTKYDIKENLFLNDLKKCILKDGKILVFFICFSAFCFSTTTQMSMAMKKLASESFSWIMIFVGLILAFMTLLMSLASVVKANTKTIAMMKVFGYSRKQCSNSILGGYRPVSYIGFAIGTIYQYVLLKIIVSVVFADFDNIPEYNFNYKAMVVSFVAFIMIYEVIMYLYSRKIDKQSVKSVMIE